MGLLDNIKAKGQQLADSVKDKAKEKFDSSADIKGDISLIPKIAEEIAKEFKAEGFTVDCKQYGDQYDLSLTNGGFLKVASGLNAALKVNIKPQNGIIRIDAGIGQYGERAAVAGLAALAAWPLAITQIWGLVKQSNLDDKAVAIAQRVVANSK